MRMLFCLLVALYCLVHTNLLIPGSCRKSNEIHDKRHREIAELLQRVLEGDEAAVVSSPLSTKKRKTRKSDVFEYYKSSTDFTNELDTEQDNWADSSTLNDDDMELIRTDLVDKKENAGSKKAQKAERKIARNQNRFKVLTFDDVKKVSEALHPLVDRNPLIDQTNNHHNSPVLPNNATINANIAFNTHTFRYSTLRPDIHIKKILKANGTPTSTISSKIPAPTSPQDSPLITTILHRLGVLPPPIHPHKERKTLLARLRNLIATDIECVDNEDRETMMRMAGYWRYANRRTYNAMIRNNQLWDWETGAKLEEIEEGEGDEDEGSISEGETAVARSEVVEDYGGDFEIADVGMLTLIDREGLADEGGDFEIRENAEEFATSSSDGIFTTSNAHSTHSPGHGITVFPAPADADDTPTPTQATFSGIKDRRFRTTPTNPILCTPSPSLITNPTPTKTPITSTVLPAITNPPTTAALAPATATIPDFPALPDRNNRFSPLAIHTPPPHSYIHTPTPRAPGPVIKIVRSRKAAIRTLAVPIPVGGGEGKGEEGSWAQVARKGKK